MNEIITAKDVQRLLDFWLGLKDTFSVLEYDNLVTIVKSIAASAAERQRLHDVTLASRFFVDDPYAMHPDIAFNDLNESARIAAHSTARGIAHKIMMDGARDLHDD
jgi:hypothetical protein